MSSFRRVIPGGAARRVAAAFCLLAASSVAPGAGPPSWRLAGNDTPVPGAYGATQLQSTYHESAGDLAGGARARVYVVDFFDANFETDLDVYRRQYGLGECSIATGCLQVVEGDGRPTTPEDYGAFASTNHGNLVAEVIAAICPRCGITAIRLHKAANLHAYTEDLVTARALGAKFVNLSVSPGSPNPSGATPEPVLDFSLWGSLPGAGRSVVFYGKSAGNTPYRPEPTFSGYTWPASSSLVTTVGGVTTAGTAAGKSKSTCFTYRATPTFQQGVSSDVCDGRAVNDVAGLRENISVYSATPSASGTGWQQKSGNSFAAPAITALAALDPPPLARGPDVDQYVYANAKAATPSTLFDPVIGKNWTPAGTAVGDWISTGDCGTRICNAAKGWDGPTGWGVPWGPSVLSPPGGGAGPIEARHLTLAGQCAGVTAGTAVTAPWPVVGLGSCTDQNYLAKWQPVPVRVVDARGRPVTAYQYVLEGRTGERLGCLRSDPQATSADGAAVVVGPCSGDSGIFRRRSTGLSDGASGLTIFARNAKLSLSSLVSSNIEVQAVA